MKERFGSFANRVLALTDGSELCWIVLTTVDSTNSLGRRLMRRFSAPSELPATTVLVAWSQESGRGRENRRWESRAGEGVWASILVPVVPRDILPLLPLVAGVALAGALQQHLRSAVLLKWPNDLYVGDAKLGGILVEGMSRGESTAAVIGFGVNHGLNPPRLEARPTTSIQLEPGSRPRLADLAVQLATSVHIAIERPLPRNQLMKKIRQLSFHQEGDCLKVSTSRGSVAGLFRGVDEQGFLVLETEGGVERVSAGEVT